jgi:hypothetical protein
MAFSRAMTFGCSFRAIAAFAKSILEIDTPASIAVASPRLSALLFYVLGFIAAPG